MGLERGPVVQGFIRVDGKAELMRFVARNIRAISPLRWDLNSGQGVLTQFDNGTVDSRPQIVNDSGTAPADMSQLPPEELRKLKGQSLPAPSQPKLVLPESSSVKKKSGELRLASAISKIECCRDFTGSSSRAVSSVCFTSFLTSPADTLLVVLRVLKELHLTYHTLNRLVDVQHVRVAWKHLVLGTIRHVRSVFLSLKNNGERKDVLNLNSPRRAL